jgi:phage gpG-like protein
MKVAMELHDEEVMKALHGLTAAAASPPLKQIGQSLVDSTKERFYSMTDPEGHAWAALSPATLQRKRVNGDRILYQYGHLFESIHAETDATSVQVGTNLVQAARLQFGDLVEGQISQLRTAKSRRGHRFVQDKVGYSSIGGIPSREFIGISSPDREAVLRIVTKHLQNRIGR